MTNKQILEKYLGTLEHFIEQGGWPIKQTSDTKDICKHIPVLIIDDEGRLCKSKSRNFNSELLVEYYKFKYEESVEMYDKLYNKVAEIAREF